MKTKEEIERKLEELHEKELEEGSNSMLVTAICTLEWTLGHLSNVKV